MRIRQLKALPGAGWITALRAPQVAALARDDGPLQMSLSGDQNFAEITDARYPGERLVCCRNPALAAPARRQTRIPAGSHGERTGQNQGVGTGGPGERR